MPACTCSLSALLSHRLAVRRGTLVGRLPLRSPPASRKSSYSARTHAALADTCQPCPSASSNVASRPSEDCWPICSVGAVGVARLSSFSLTIWYAASVHSPWPLQNACLRPISVCLASLRSNCCWLGLSVSRLLTPSVLVAYWPYSDSSGVTSKTNPARQLSPLRLRSALLSASRVSRWRCSWS